MPRLRESQAWRDGHTNRHRWTCARRLAHLLQRRQSTCLETHQTTGRRGCRRSRTAGRGERRVPGRARPRLEDPLGRVRRGLRPNACRHHEERRARRADAIDRFEWQSSRARRRASQREAPIAARRKQNTASPSSCRKTAQWTQRLLGKRQEHQPGQINLRQHRMFCAPAQTVVCATRDCCIWPPHEICRKLIIHSWVVPHHRH